MKKEEKIKMDKQPTFGGYATRYNVKCSDGRTILNDAFKHCDGIKVPLVWNHSHNDPSNVVGHAILEHRDDGVYAHGYFNNTQRGLDAKEDVIHGDITGLSIYANRLKQRGPVHDRYVERGDIKELSLVFATANDMAFIDTVLSHGENAEDEEVIIYSGEEISLSHSDDENVEETAETEETKETEEISHADESETEKNGESDDDESIADILTTLNEKQQEAVAYVIGEVIKQSNQPEADEKEESDTNNEEINHSEGGNDTMKNNVFDQNNSQENVLVHADIVNDAIADGKRYGLLSDSIMAHAAENNITDIQELFPNDHDLNMPPEWYKENDDSWVAKVMRGVHHVPFSRVRALFAKMDEATARAHGYIKGNEKQVGLKLSILKRTTKPTTVYIKMAMDRDDLIDIQYDALPWIRAEGRKVLDAELARAYLFGDKRDPSDDDKIDEQCIRPILTDDDMYTIKYTVTDGKDFHNDFNSASDNDSEAKGVIRGAIKARKGYKGSGNLTFFTTEDLVTELLLIEDQNGRRIYESEAALCTALRCKEIVTVPELEQYEDVYGIFVNLNDYQVGADKGGQVTTFEDFDIDYNKEKILMETRCSAALVKPKSAIVLKKAVTAG
jgi:HK97 family phage prohead protease